MINLEKANRIIDELEQTSLEMKNVAVLSDDMKKCIKNLDKAMSQMEKEIEEIISFDQKAKELGKDVLLLRSKVQEIREDYHRVCSAIELFDADSKANAKKIENLSLDIEGLHKKIETFFRETKSDMAEMLEKNASKIKNELASNNEEIIKQLKINRYVSVCVGIGLAILTIIAIFV